jgi:hypothetical protein
MKDLVASAGLLPGDKSTGRSVEKIVGLGAAVVPLPAGPSGRPPVRHAGASGAGRLGGGPDRYGLVSSSGRVPQQHGHGRRLLTSPEAERHKPVWDLTVFGHTGMLRFTGISQPWLRQATQS